MQLSCPLALRRQARDRNQCFARLFKNSLSVSCCCKSTQPPLREDSFPNSVCQLRWQRGITPCSNSHLHTQPGPLIPACRTCEKQHRAKSNGGRKKAGYGNNLLWGASIHWRWRLLAQHTFWQLTWIRGLSSCQPEGAKLTKVSKMQGRNPV